MIPVIIGFAVNGWNVYRALRPAGVPPVVIDNDRDSVFWKYAGPRPMFASSLEGQPLQEVLDELGRNTNEQYLVISAVEDAVRYLNANRERLAPNIRLDFPERDVVSRLLDKKLFYLSAVEAGCPIYPMWFLGAGWDVEGGMGQVEYPCIIKTREKMYVKGLAKAYRAETRVDLERVVGELQRLPQLKPEDLVIQRWVEGGDGAVLFCMQYYNERHEPVASFVGRKLRQWPPHVGGTSSARPHDDAEVLEQTTRYFQSVRMRGLCSMEFKRSDRDGKLSMIEPTVCRADFQEGCAVANGCNLPLAMYYSVTGRPIAGSGTSGKRPITWLYAGPDYQSAERQGLTKWEWIRSLAGPKSFAVYDPEDRGPFVELVRRKIAAKWRRQR